MLPCQCAKMKRGFSVCVCVCVSGSVCVCVLVSVEPVYSQALHTLKKEKGKSLHSAVMINTLRFNTN